MITSMLGSSDKIKLREREFLLILNLKKLMRGNGKSKFFMVREFIKISRNNTNMEGNSAEEKDKVKAIKR